MRIAVVLLVSVLLLTAACGNRQSGEGKEASAEATQEITEAPASAKKYQIKSGTVTFENTVTSSGMVIKQKSVVYFDDYGIKERKDTYDDEGSLTESFFSDGNNLYTLIHEDKIAFEVGQAYRGTELKFDWDEISAEDKNNGKATKGTNETVAGKDCEVFYHETDLGKAKFAGWNNICLLTEVAGSFGQTINRAVEIKEGSVGADMFVVPAGYSLEKR